MYTSMPVNLGQSRSQGFELPGDLEPYQGVHFGAGYTYTESIITENPDDTTQVGKNNPDAPRSEILTNVGYTYHDLGSIWFKGRYFSSRYTDVTKHRLRRGVSVLPDGDRVGAERRRLRGLAQALSRAVADRRGLQHRRDAGPSLRVGPNETVHIAWWTGHPGRAGVQYGQSTDHGASFCTPVALGLGAFSRPAHAQLAIGSTSSGPVVLRHLG